MAGFGFVNPILAQAGTRMIIAGHQRLKAALANGETEVPVIFLAFDDVTAKAYNLADNRTAQEAEWDLPPLADVLADLKAGGFDLSRTGFEENELNRLMGWGGSEVAEDEMPEAPDEPVTKPGDAWVLGRHRLMCGDSTNPEHVAGLMAGKMAKLFATDPPYLVGYTGIDRPEDKGKDWSGVYHEVEEGQAEEFYPAVFCTAALHLDRHAAWYCWLAHREELLENSIGEGHRPGAWWEYDSPGPKLTLADGREEDGLAALVRLGEATPKEVRPFLRVHVLRFGEDPRQREELFQFRPQMRAQYEHEKRLIEALEKKGRK